MGMLNCTCAYGYFIRHSIVHLLQQGSRILLVSERKKRQFISDLLVTIVMFKLISPTSFITASESEKCRREFVLN